MHKFLKVLSGVQQTPMGLAEGRGKFGMETSRPLVAELSRKGEPNKGRKGWLLAGWVQTKKFARKCVLFRTFFRTI